MDSDKKANIIEVSMAEMRIASAPAVMVTRGLGSCVGITLYDPIKKIGALAHPMLPDINRAKVKLNPAKFVNSAIDKMVKDLINKGCKLRSLKAKVFGGGHMFSTIPYSSPFNIGIKNVEKTREVFNSLGVKIVSEDVAGNYGRTIEFNISTGDVRVKTLFHGEKEL